jgi:hypothetical protein
MDLLAFKFKNCAFIILYFLTAIMQSLHYIFIYDITLYQTSILLRYDTVEYILLIFEKADVMLN